MRKLYAVEDSKLNTLQKIHAFAFTEEQYNDLLEKISTLADDVDNSKIDFNTFKEDLSNQITTFIFNTTRATIDEATIKALVAESFSSNTIISESIQSDTLTINEDALIERLNSTFARITDLVANNIQSDSIESNNIITNTIKANTAEIDEYDITNLVSDDATISNATIQEATIENESVHNLISNNATIDDLKVKKADIEDLTSKYSKLQSFEYEFSKNIEDIYQSLDTYAVGSSGDYYIVLPKFTNGTYFLIALDENDNKVWSMEINNSTRNIWFAWSVNSTNKWLTSVEVIEDSTDELQFIQIHGKTFGNALKLYHRCDSFSNEIVPNVYSTKQFDGTQDFTFENPKGIWMPNAVFAGSFHADTLEIDEVEFENLKVKKTIELPSTVDLYGEPLSWSTGHNNDYITNVTDEYGNTNVQWITPASEVARDDERLITSDAISKYTGQVGDEYPITELGDGSEVHGDLKVDGSTSLKNFYNGPESDFNPSDFNDNSIVIFTESDNYTANKIYRYRDGNLEEIIASTELQNGKPVIYDEETNSYKTADELTIDELNVTELHADKAFIKELDTVKEETISSTGDYTVLRANNPAALDSNDYSGILVHNYDGNGADSAVVSDSEGIFRVGTGNPTNTTYATLFYNKADGTYYIDDTTVVEPEGALTSWSYKNDTDEYIEYKDAVFSKIEFDTLEPILTRDEASDMSDKGLVVWDSEELKAKTIDVPTTDEQTLTAVVSEDEDGNTSIDYKWVDKVPGTFVFDTLEEYEEYNSTHNIPIGSQVIIEKDTNYLVGEDIHG